MSTINDDLVKQLTSNKHPKKRNKIDTTNDAAMVGTGIRLPHVSMIKDTTDPNYEFRKTAKEKAALRKIKSRKSMSGSMTPLKDKPDGVLKVYVENKEHSNTFKTTRSYTCNADEIRFILSNVANYMYSNGSKYNIIKATFNGVAVKSANYE